jgi:predicted RNA polymerase sigma factor
VTAGETHQAIEATVRIERARLIAGLARVVRNVDLGEGLPGADEELRFSE